MNADLLAKFRSVLMQMEPENLFQDGERSRSDANQAMRRLTREWGQLERLAGRSVSQNEIWSSLSR